MPRIVLLGDSIFDNAAYVGSGHDVVEQLRALLPAGWTATLLAVDGSVTRSVAGQLPRIPHDATHLVLSVGGNDALGHMDILDRPARSTGEVLDLLAELRSGFEVEYRWAIQQILELKVPLTICTIYEGALPGEAVQRRASTALTVFNDVVLRVGFELRLRVIDLRSVCSSPEDYANPIEPSVVGGGKIAEAIRQALVTNDPGARITG